MFDSGFEELAVGTPTMVSIGVSTFVMPILR